MNSVCLGVIGHGTQLLVTHSLKLELHVNCSYPFHAKQLNCGAFLLHESGTRDMSVLCPDRLFSARRKTNVPKAY